jgi:hypothetical protein
MCYPYPTFANFPDPGEEELLYLAEDTGAVYRCTGGEYIPLRGKPVFLTKAEYEALENPSGSGKYPSLIGERLIVADAEMILQIDVLEDGTPFVSGVVDKSLVHRPDIENGTDFNDVMTEGIYDVPLGNTYTNAPVASIGSEGILTVLRSGGATRQRFDVLDPDSESYERVYDGAWQEWKKVLHLGSDLKNYFPVPDMPNRDPTNLIAGKILDPIVFPTGAEGSWMMIEYASYTAERSGFYYCTRPILKSGDTPTK